MNKVVTLFTLLCLAGFAVDAQAQMVPRNVLLEEGTNWSCPPCATLNPLVEYFVQSHPDNLIQICYHPNWPGADDPMYLNDQTDNQSRVVTYYGISGVPSVVVDGSTPFNPNSVALMETPYQTRIQKLTPVKITMDRSVSGSTVTVNVHVTAVAALGTTDPMYLRVAAVERYVDRKGPNGEPRYVNPLRQMMPDYKGTKLTLNVGETQDFTFTYPLKAAYRAEKMFEVAFVQDDKSKEVFQAASTEEKFQLMAKAGESSVKKLGTDGGGTMLQVNNTTGESLWFNAHYVPVIGKDWTVTINGSQDASVNLDNGSIGNITLGVTPGTSPYTTGVVVVSTVTGRGDTIENSYPVKFISPTTNIAFVDVSGDSASSVNTLKTMTSMNLRYVPLTATEATAADGWKSQAFQTIVLEGNKWIVTGPDKAGVQAYLASGGHLLIHGGEIGFGLTDPSSTDVDVAFMKDVLHSSYVKDSAGPRTVLGVTDDIISGPFSTTPVNIYGVTVDNPNQPDQIKPENGAVPIFYYGTGTSQVAGIRWDDGNARLAYLAFGLQNLATTPRQQIITQVLKWFGAVSGVTDPGKPVLSLDQNYPNPFTNVTAISYSLPKDGIVHLTLMDVKGTTVRELVNGTQSFGPHSVTFDPTGLAKGTYFYTLRTEEGSMVKAMTIE